MRHSTLAAVLISAVTIAVLPGATHAGPFVVYVDSSALPGGDGSEGNPVPTIHEGIARLPRRGGVVAIHPGTYVGRIVIERDNVVLWGLADPFYDADGFLAGFEDEVVITIDEQLKAHDEFSNPPVETEDAVELRGSNNEVHNVVIDLPAWATSGSGFSSCLSAKAEDDDFYDGIVMSHILIRHQGMVPNDIWTSNTNALIEYVTSLDIGGVGISPAGNGDVEVAHAHVANKDVSVCYLVHWEFPGDENGPSLLTGSIHGCRLRDTNAGPGGSAQGFGLLIAARIGDRDNPDERSAIILEAHDNTFENTHNGIKVVMAEFATGVSSEETLVALKCSGNRYIDNLRDVDIEFSAKQNFAPHSGGQAYAENSELIVADGDLIFPDPSDVDLGPEENGNVYELIDLP